MPPITLYVATSNPGKLRDFAIAAENRVTIKPLPGLVDIPAPPEDSPYFEGNARAKALFYAHYAPGSLVLADDSGLEVQDLNGAPGVRSARYADDLGFPVHPGTSLDGRNNLCLVEHLAHFPGPHRARYRCVLAVARAGPVSPERLARLPERICRVKETLSHQIIAVAHGIVEGEILLTPRGTGGFGYDPLFLLPDLGLTMAELDPATRLSLSHRGRALRNLIPRL